MQLKTVQEIAHFLVREANKIGAHSSGELEKAAILEFANHLKKSDIETALEDSECQKNGKNPLIHLYEAFLKKSDPKKKLKRGVFYTPFEVVSFIVRSVDQLTRAELKLPNGLAEDVVILDPATGTGAFLIEIVELIKKEFENEGEKSNEKWSDYVSISLLPRLIGLEIMPTPYAITLLNIRLKLEETGYISEINDDLNIFLANTLEENSIKMEYNKPIIVLGNPPYSVSSQNKGKWIDDLLKKGYSRPNGTKSYGYYSLDSKPLGEKSVKALGDDYVKFVRWAQWKVDQAGEGVVGYITNNSYLDNPTFRGMRQSLLNSFNRIYVLNLHGSAIKGEEAPDGSADENVFDIKQGVAITFFVKSKKYKESKVFYADLYGKRDYKFKWLEKNNFDSVEWREVEVRRPYYFFVPKDYSLEEEYNSFWSLTDIFQKPYWCQGIITSRDHLTIKRTPEEVWETVNEFARMDPDEARERFDLRKDSKSWQVEDAQRDLLERGLTKEKIVPILYRPFDVRYTYYTGKTCGFHFRPRKEVMQHIIGGDNIGLLVCRQQRKIGFHHAFITKYIVDCCVISNKTREGNFLFPLYFTVNNEKKTTIDPKLFQYLVKLYSAKISPEQIFYYVYGMLHSNKVRNKFAEFLRYDFPRIFFTEYFDDFTAISEIGKELADLHLMKTKLEPEVQFIGNGSNEIESINYDANKTFLNAEQYFQPVPKEAWDFKIGSYNVLKKWLSDKKKTEISSLETNYFIQMVEIAKNTIKNAKEIDELLPF